MVREVTGRVSISPTLPICFVTVIGVGVEGVVGFVLLWDFESTPSARKGCSAWLPLAPSAAHPCRIMAGRFLMTTRGGTSERIASRLRSRTTTVRSVWTNSVRNAFRVQAGLAKLQELKATAAKLQWGWGWGVMLGDFESTQGGSARLPLAPSVACRTRVVSGPCAGR